MKPKRFTAPARRPGPGPERSRPTIGRTIQGLGTRARAKSPRRSIYPPAVERVSETYRRRLLRDQAELHRFLLGHEPLVISVATLYRREWDPDALQGERPSGKNERVVTMRDLIQAGHVGQLKALRKFDPSRGVKWATYAIWFIRSEMQRSLRAHSDGAMRLPQHIRDTRQALVNTPPEVRDHAELHRVEQTIRRVSYPLRLDHAKTDDGKLLRNLLPGPPDDFSPMYARELAKIICAALVRIAGNRPYRDPPFTYSEQAAAVVWSADRPIEFEIVAERVAQAGQAQPTPKFQRKIRSGLGGARKQGWIEVLQNGGPRRYSRRGPPRPSPEDRRNVEIMRWRIGVAEPLGRIRTLKDIGDEHNLSRERVRQIEEAWLERLRQELEGINNGG